MAGRETGQAGRGGQLINNVEEPKNEGRGARVCTVLRPRGQPLPCPIVGAKYLGREGGAGEVQGRTHCLVTTTLTLPTF